MSDRSARPGSNQFALLVGVLILVAVGVTVLASYLIVEEPEGFVFWTRTLFLCFIELVFGALLISSILRLPNSMRTTGATTMYVYGLFTLYAVIGLGSIIAYQYLRDPEAPKDTAFAAVLLVITTGFFVFTVFVAGFDIFFQKSNASIQEVRRDHDRRARSLNASIAVFRSIDPGNSELAVEFDRTLKRLERLETNLAHSHGGGGGSWESGPDVSEHRAADMDIALALDEVTETINELNAANESSQKRHVLESLNAVTRRLSSFVESYDLN